MSALFGPVIQQGYVVPDVQAAMRHWIARGIGPFFVEEHIRPKGDYDGERIQPDLSAAFAYSGEQQIEVIEQHDDEPTIYRDYLAAHPDGGLQHLAVWVDNIAETVDDLDAAGRRYTVRQRYGDGHAYLDSEEEPGVMVQLMARSDHLVELMETIRVASIGWDGVTAPIRRIDWSTGKPVPEVVED
jgi:catechol 2,3-dioxygenase-like lactoylglutathione lyase family enzyme